LTIRAAGRYIHSSLFRPLEGKIVNDRGTFWNRNFLLGLAGYFFLFMAVSNFFLFPLVLQKFGARQSQIGLVMGVHSVMAIGIRPFFGRIIDRGRGQRFALAGVLILLVTTPFFHLVRDAGALPVLLRALTGLGWGIGMTATISVCSDLAPAGSLARSMGIIGVAGLVANALGPLIAEEVIERFGSGGLYNLSLVFLAASLACVLATREPPCPSGARPASAAKPWRSAAPLALMVIASMPVFHGAVRGAMINFIALFGRSVGISHVGPFFLVFSGAAILTRFGLADLSDRHGRKRVIFPAALLISLNLFALSQVRSSPLFLVTGFVGGLGQGLIFPALSTYIIDFLGRGRKALAISLYLSLFDVGMGLGSPFFGWISDLTGYRWMYVFAGALLLVATLIFMVRAPATETDERAIRARETLIE
jgi:MFS family permease